MSSSAEDLKDCSQHLSAREDPTPALKQLLVARELSCEPLFLSGKNGSKKGKQRGLLERLSVLHSRREASQVLQLPSLQRDQGPVGHLYELSRQEDPNSVCEVYMKKI